MKTSWFICPKPSPRAIARLFCFPYAGGSALIFRSWPEGLGPDIEVYAAQLPGRGHRLSEAPFTSLPDLINAMLGPLTRHLDKPFAFFGHSMGALISFELTRRLRSESLQGPLHLFVSGRRAPHIPNLGEPIYNLPEQEFIEHLRNLNGTPKEVLEHPELMQLMMPLLRADFQISQTDTYTEGAALDCPITAFGGLQDRDTPREQMEGWRQHTTGPFVLRMFPGDHFFLHTNESSLLQMLSADLRESVRRGPTRG